jgi:hypothetical protein
VCAMRRCFLLSMHKEFTMENKRLTVFVISVLCGIMSGCVALLPKETRVTVTPWESFNGAKAAYEKVDPRVTTTTQLKTLGFALYSTPNIRILNYLDIAAATIPLKREDLSEGLALCLKAQTKCWAYEFEPQVIHSDRYGNFWLDVLNFKRHTRDKGWRFKALFVVVDNVVVEKFWSGNPVIDLDYEKYNPIGPFQDAGGMILNLVPK